MCPWGECLGGTCPGGGGGFCPVTWLVLVLGDISVGGGWEEKAEGGLVGEVRNVAGWVMWVRWMR